MSVTGIDRFVRHGDRLEVWFDGRGEPLVLPWFWVRDHSRDASSLDPHTLQRTVDSFGIDLDLTPADCRLVDGDLIVEWADGFPRSVVTAGLLASVVPVGSDPRLWRRAANLQLAPASYDDVIATDDGLARWLHSIDRVGVGLLRGAPPAPSGATSIADRIGYVRRTVFGDVWTLSSEIEAHADSAYSDSFLEPHTDGSYSHDGPGLQLFVCGENTGTGGESVVVDGFAAAAELRDAAPDAFDILTEVIVPSHYIEPGIHLRAARPVIRLDAAGRIAQITFNNYDRSPFLLPPSTMRRWYEAYAALHELLDDRDGWWVHRLEPGEVLLFDNWRCLHGRLAYRGTRVFHGCYLNHEDLESRLRVVDLA